MNKSRRKIVLGSLCGMTLLPALNLVHAARSENLSLKSLSKDLIKYYGNKNIIESNNIEISFGKMRQKTHNGEKIFMAESSAVIPFYIHTKNIKIDSVLVILQNPKTLENTFVAKYDVNDSFADEISSRFRLMCKNTTCRAFVIANTKDSVLVSSELVAWWGCTYDGI